MNGNEAGKGRRKRRQNASRDGGRFIGLPHAVLESQAFLGLSLVARAMLLEVALQYHGDDNGRMLLSRKHLATRGWASADSIQRGKNELLEAGFVYQTVQGQRPNRASWFACTWWALDKLDGYDAGAAAGFERSAYLTKGGQTKNAALVPATGTERVRIAPAIGTETPRPVPIAGTIQAVLSPAAVPIAGHPLEVPSARAVGCAAPAACASTFTRQHALLAESLSAHARAGWPAKRRSA